MRPRADEGAADDRGAVALAPPSLRALWATMATLCAAQFVTVLDYQIVALALPAIQDGLGVGDRSVQWVVTALALALAGSLLLAGRAADLFGARRLFILGLLVLALGAGAAGLATSIPGLVGARAVQGIGTALITPAALAMVSTTFPEGTARTRAIGVWNVMGPLGGIAGIVLGGVLIAGPGWVWVFWMAVPVAVVALVAARWTLPVGWVTRDTGHIDGLGAFTGSAGLIALVFGLGRVAGGGFGALPAIGSVACGAALLVLFVAVERRTPFPIHPLGILRRRALPGANAVAVLQAAVTNTPIFFVVLTLQGMGGWSATRTGLAFLPCNAALIVGTAVGTRVTNSRGARWTLVCGMAILAASSFWLSRGLHGGYLTLWLPHLLLLGFGLGATAVAVNVAGIAGAAAEEHGLAWGLINTSARIGTAVGLALLVAVAGVRTDALAGGASPTDAETLAGYRAAFLAAGILALVGVVVAARWLPRAPVRCAFPERALGDL